jgi:hypothetical protein
MRSRSCLASMPADRRIAGRRPPVLAYLPINRENRRFGVLSGASWRVRPAPGRPGPLRGMAWRLGLFALNFCYGRGVTAPRSRLAVAASGMD